MLQCWRRTGICPLFSSPTREIWQLKSPQSREFAIQGKKMLMPGGHPRKGGGGGVRGAGGGIDWCITPEFAYDGCGDLIFCSS